MLPSLSCAVASFRHPAAQVPSIRKISSVRRMETAWCKANVLSLDSLHGNVRCSFFDVQGVWHDQGLWLACGVQFLRSSRMVAPIHISHFFNLRIRKQQRDTKTPIQNITRCSLKIEIGRKNKSSIMRVMNPISDNLRQIFDFFKMKSPKNQPPKKTKTSKIPPKGEMPKNNSSTCITDEEIFIADKRPLR